MWMRWIKRKTNVECMRIVKRRKLASNYPKLVSDDYYGQFGHCQRLARTIRTGTNRGWWREWGKRKRRDVPEIVREFQLLLLCYCVCLKEFYFGGQQATTRIADPWRSPRTDRVVTDGSVVSRHADDYSACALFSANLLLWPCNHRV